MRKSLIVSLFATVALIAAPGLAQAQPPADSNTIVSSDMLALASHMSDCQRSHGPFLKLLAALDWAKSMAAGRIVTTGAVIGATGLCLLLALS